MYRYSESSSSDSDCLNGSEKIIELSHKSMDYDYLFQYFEGYEKDVSDVNHIKPEGVDTIILYHNQLVDIPLNISIFQNLRVVDVSSNRLKRLPEVLLSFPLTSLIAKNNLLEDESLPKSFESLSPTLRNLNFSGNNLTQFPPQIFQAKNLLYIYLGSNRIEEIPKDIINLTRYVQVYL